MGYTHPETAKKWRLSHPEYAREWWRNNRARAAEYTRSWMAKHPEYKRDPEKKREDRARYRKKHREELRVAALEYYRKNIEKVRIKTAKWAQNNRDKRCRNEATRRARKAQTSSQNNEQIDRIYARAKELRQWFNVVVDHIIPLSRGGNHSADNLQIIYLSENVKKRNHMNYKPRVIFT